MPDTNTTATPIKVLFVCLGNICRSPLAEGVFRHHVEQAGLSDRFEIDSCGTGSWHVGEMPDPRMRQTAERHGLSIDDQRGRQLIARDLEEFDYIFAMDQQNLRGLYHLDDEENHRDKIFLFRQLDPEPGDYQVPDPYFGGELEGFEHVYQLVERTSKQLLNHLVEKHGLAVTP